MTDLQPAYKEALLTARDVFDEKYEGLMSDALDDMHRTYLIDPHSRLAGVMKFAMRKFLVGVDMKIDIFSDWFDAHADNTPGIISRFHLAYPLMVDKMFLIASNAEPSQELLRLVNVERGRNTLIAHTLQLIVDNIDDVQTGDKPYRVLGSLISRSIDVHCSAHDGKVTMAFPRNYNDTSRALAEKCEEIRLQISVPE